MYNFETKSAVNLLSTSVEKNVQKISETFQKQIKSAEEMIDVQCKIASYFIGWWFSGVVSQPKGCKELDKLLFSAFHKNIILFFSALRLNSMGLFGSLRPLIRNIFEWLMISKLSSISDDTVVIKRWHNKETIYFSNAVLKKIQIPSSKPFSEFWSIICDFTHATRFSMQTSLEIEGKDDFKDIAGNYAVVNALLECNYHLLNTHLITQECEYMGKFYFGSKRFSMPEYKIPDLKKKAHSIFKNNREDFNKELVTLITNYKRKWVLNN